jgi:hypothetical protein
MFVLQLSGIVEPDGAPPVVVVVEVPIGFPTSFTHLVNKINTHGITTATNRKLRFISLKYEENGK